MAQRVDMNESVGVITPLTQSDPTEADLIDFLEQEHGPFPGYENVSGSSLGMRAIDPGGGNHLVMVHTSKLGSDLERSLHFITQGLEYPHEFPIHFMPARTTFAGHLIDGEVGGYHLSHK